MEPNTYEAIQTLIRNARRARAEAMWKFIAAALDALARSPACIATPPAIREERELSWPNAPGLELAVRRAAWKYFRRRLLAVISRTRLGREWSMSS